jgi:predicted ATPase
MAVKLKRLLATTQEAIKQRACLGKVVDIATLILVHGKTEEAMHAALWKPSTPGSSSAWRAPTNSCTPRFSRRRIP